LKQKETKKMEASRMSNLEEQIKTLADWMFEAKRLVAFTGAGISRE